MSSHPSIQFAAPSLPTSGVLVILSGADGAIPEGLPSEVSATLMKAATFAKFKGKSLSIVEAAAPSTSDLDRVMLVGTIRRLRYGWRHLRKP